MSSSSSPVIKLDLSHQKLLIQPDDPLPIFYPRPEAVMVIPIYDKREVYENHSGSPSYGYHGNSPGGRSMDYDSVYDDPRYDNRGGRDPRYYRHHEYYSPRGGGPYGRQFTRRSYSSDADDRRRYDPRADMARSRPVGQGPAHPIPGAAHINPSINPSEQGRPTSTRPPNSHQQQAHTATTHGKPPKPGFFASLLGPSNSHGSSGSPGTHAASHNGHAPSQGIAHSQSQGGRQNNVDPLQNMRLPPATRMLLQYARDKGILGELTNYLQTLPPAPNFTYSKCTGKKKAVCIGINYVGQRDELKGCANDARNMRDFLMRNYGFQSQNILMLVDDGHGRGQPRPTRKEMFNAMSWLIKGANCHDSLFFHYSGHGGQSPDASGKELDGMDEVIFPMDYDQGAGDIIDDELHEALVTGLAPGVRLTAVFDSCHSGTVLDLPYLHSAHGRLRGLGHISQRAKKRGASDSADVICLAACKDDEKSTDTREGGVAVGAMSWAFIQALEQDKSLTYEQLLHHLRATLVPKYHQKAQISGTHPVDMTRQFTL